MRMILEFFKDHFGIVIAVTIIGLLGLYLTVGRSGAAIGLQKTTGVTTQVQYSDVTMYDGMPVKGLDVIDFVKKQYKASGSDGYFAISIGGTTITTNDVSSTVISRATYTCAVTKDSAGAVTKVEFTKN